MMIYLPLVKCDEEIIFLSLVLVVLWRHARTLNTLLRNNISPTQGIFEDDVPFSQGRIYYILSWMIFISCVEHKQRNPLKQDFGFSVGLPSLKLTVRP